MKIKNHISLLLFMTFLPHAIAQSNTKPLFLGSVAGDGRACYGYLKVTPKWLTWKAHFGGCYKVPYVVSRQEHDDKHTYIEFRIPENAKCDLHIITMEQKQDDPMISFSSGWSVRGFSTESGFKDDMDTIGCLMY